MINEYENVLRAIIIDILGNNASTYKVSEERVEKWYEKKVIEQKKNNGGMVAEERIIYYSDIYDLKTIISKNWDSFLPVFLNKKRFDVFFEEIEGYRNTVMHGRNLTKSQNLLLEGILLDLKVLKTIYHNKNEMKDDFFIRILKINDNLGNVWSSELEINEPVLRVGDDYELLIEAVDPKGREIGYEITSMKGNLQIAQKENRFNFKITKDMISPNLNILVCVRTPDSEYLNRDLFSVMITVLPS